MKETFDEILDKVTGTEYQYGFETDIETLYIPKGLTEETIRLISKKKEEPEWLLEFRLEAFRYWQTWRCLLGHISIYQRLISKILFITPRLSKSSIQIPKWILSWSGLLRS